MSDGWPCPELCGLVESVVESVVEVVAPFFGLFRVGGRGEALVNV